MLWYLTEVPLMWITMILMKNSHLPKHSQAFATVVALQRIVLTLSS
ncbi:hypothetical protein BAZSYMA_ACONTIG168713_2 [Bathymodiolus azoricus thioautotrophic gill symbiont]|uniref:Uncharacterized protein n=1 Tax=Bathymodiolus azoricus thioautotrophic gill symbiont TaxID=235205 RepID=A0A1H6MCJ0_9GAMM|nr:hypothetical protein BAZSYMA_ACONTIG168713_2 [Bathymodiolus azoricus thioautotrophic gill symbiont]